ncbi:heme-binding protein [Myxococcota bacterium]|nr:heme-binding protein [Myxococcota bacterium]
MKQRNRFVRAAVVIVLIAMPATASRAIEEPAYEVERSEGRYEVRSYGPRIVAETWVVGTQEDAGNTAFRRLADYIFGGNATEESIAMTAPVTQESPQVDGLETEVTTMPVEGRYRVTFTMPGAYSMATLPPPDDDRVVLREESGRRVATIRYSGFWSTSRYQHYEKELMEWIEAQNLEASGAPPVWARYDPPFMPWFLRRNEIHIELAPNS